MLELAVILALVVVNGLFAGAEIAVLTIRRTRIAELVEEKRDDFAALGAPVEVADDVALGVVGVMVFFLSLVIGELVPKSLAMRFAEGYGLAIARPLSLIAKLASPVVPFLTFCSNLLLRFFGDRTSFTEARLSREELQTLVEETATAGALDPNASEIASRALDLPGLKISAVMTARSSVVAIPAAAARAQVLEALEKHPFGRFPVHDGSLDGIQG